MGNLKNFVGEYAYNVIKNSSFDEDAIRKALVTPQNAREVFSELTEFEIKSLCFEISCSGTIGQVKKATQEEIVNLFNLAGYDKVIFDDEEGISECRKYYRQGEVICTYSDLRSRMREYHMLVAVKKDIDKIERPECPSRDDEYGTSILNIQIARNGSHMSIKNRYNHTVSQPDSTLDNNLDALYIGLQSMVLGYYGFASLSGMKARYAHIVNIGGTYLKYHTEIGNVYFGSFVLDGVNGVRFADARRYYVTKPDKSYGAGCPLILDFQNKKAVNICCDADGKTHLLSRAMREHVLTSANKGEASTIAAVFHDAKKELLQSNKNALKFLHERYGYDFTKPFKVTGFLGRFTVKSIANATGMDAGTLLTCTIEDLRLVEMWGERFYAKDLRGDYKYDIHTYYGQGSFEEARKSGSLATYVIQQDPQYMGKPKSKDNTSYSYNRYHKPELDKSGCDITEARAALWRRCRQYQADKRAREAAERDYSKDIAELNTLFANLKAELIVQLTNAKEFDDYEKIRSVIDYTFVWMTRDIREIEKSVLNRSFTSVESACAKINTAKATILKKSVALAGAA